MGLIGCGEDDMPMTANTPVESSIVMPCLNEADTLEVRITKAQQALREHQIDGEVIVADNGNTDGSPEIVRWLGTRFVPVL